MTYYCLAQVWEGKPTEEKNKDSINGEVKCQKPSEVSSVVVKEGTPAAHANGDVKVSENGSVTKSGEVPKGAKPVGAEKIMANGVANGC